MELTKEEKNPVHSPSLQKYRLIIHNMDLKAIH